MNLLSRLFAMLVLSLALLAGNGVASLASVDLKAEFAVNPLGVDILQPRLSWKLTSDSRGDKQTAYEILTASSAELLTQNKGDLWRSSKVKSDETIQVRYNGKPLKSSQQVFWKVRVWDKNKSAANWSSTASFNSVRGKILSDWKRDGDTFTLRVTVPPNTTARVSLPSKPGTPISESGSPVARSREIKFIRQAGNRAILQIGSGSYEFQTTY